MFVWLLAACTPTSAIPPLTPSGTAPSGTVISPTSTAVPSANSLSPTELKYQLLAEFPALFFCDSDFYPVAREDEGELALQRFPEIAANGEEFQAILKHQGLDGLIEFTDEQKLLIYREHKKLAVIQLEPTGDEYQFQVQVAEASEQGFLIRGRIDSSGTISVETREPTIATCPICLAAHTQIDTPDGPVAVETLRRGDSVWTVDATGTRQPATVLRTTRVVVPARHPMLHLVLADGRELWVSPGHPTAEGKPLGDLRTGDLLDGARVTHSEQVAYNAPATYDLLPSGGTGFYWANGILIGSTLSAP